MAVADRLVPMITEITPVNESVMTLIISHILGVISMVSVYAATGVSERSVKEEFYAQLGRRNKIDWMSAVAERERCPGVQARTCGKSRRT